MDHQQIAADLRARGLSYCPNCFPESFLRPLRDEFDQKRRAQLFRRASTGKQGRIDDQTRRDEICWLEPTNANAALRIELEALRTFLNRSLFLGIREYEVHYSEYPSGGFYERHRDCFKHDDSRVVSFILYLNENWLPEFGGWLRLYESDRVTDLPPEGGTLVCFLSRELEHEVRVTHVPRRAITGWFKT